MQLDKNQLRKQLINRRKTISENEKQLMDNAVFNKVIALEEFEKADTILTYISTDIEVETTNIINFALENNKQVAVPVTTQNSMDFYFINHLNSLVKSNFGILEPVDLSKPVIDFSNSLCIVPALAYNNSGFRLGYGKGYYDKFLAKFNGVSVGIIYKDYIFNIPTENYDVAVDLLLTN